MNRWADSLLAAYENKDASTFVGTCVQLQKSKGDRETTAERLLQVVCKGDVSRAEIAVNVLQCSGLVLDDECYEGLISAAEKRFPPNELARLAADNSNRLATGTSKSVLYRLRLLRSTIHALLRRDDPHGVAFITKVEREVAGTQLAQKIVTWKKNKGNG
jgi:hypothetical protein